MTPFGNKGVSIITNSVARIGPGLRQSVKDPGVRLYHSVESFLAAHHECDVIVLEMPGKQAGEALRLLRRQVACRYIPIYCRQDQTALCQALGDGVAPIDSEQITSLAQAWKGRYAKLDAGQLESSFEARILAWLWLLGSRRLQAVRNTDKAGFYEYPLLEALAPDASGAQLPAALQHLVQRGFLAPTELVDRLRLCVRCGSGRLNYVDACPQCGSIDIARQSSMRCVACGYTGAEENFLNDASLRCPACRSKLRHIGLQYDRQDESYSCDACAAVFTQAVVRVHCLDCDAGHDPLGLRVHEVHGYQLSEAGRLHCRQSLSAGFDYQEQLDIPGLLGAEAFRYSLDWLLDMHRRYGTPGFSLLGLRLFSVPKTRSERGADRAQDERRAYALVDSLLDRLVDVMREADRCARTREDLLWLLLPNTDSPGLAKVKQRLSDLARRVGDDTLEIDLRMAGVSAPPNIRAHESADLLMARLTDELLD